MCLKIKSISVHFSFVIAYATTSMGYKINQQLGDKIARVRKEKKLTQDQLAEEIGVQTATISNIETGKTDTSVYTVFKIAQALRLHIKELFVFR